MDITLTIDETQPTQTIFCKDLNAFLHVDILPQSSIDDQMAQAQAMIDRGQAIIDSLTPVTASAVTIRQGVDMKPQPPA